MDDITIAMSNDSADAPLMAHFAGETFDAVRIVAIGLPATTIQAQPAPDAFISTGQHWQFPVIARYQCTQEQAELVIALWNQLPDSEQMRCHVPGFAIEVLLGPEVVFTAALCWECHNVSIGGRLAQDSWRTFTDPGGKLLGLCKEVTKNQS